jgi:hypothetical protein
LLAPGGYEFFAPHVARGATCYHPPAALGQHLCLASALLLRGARLSCPGRISCPFRELPEKCCFSFARCGVCPVSSGSLGGPPARCPGLHVVPVFPGVAALYGRYPGSPASATADLRLAPILASALAARLKRTATSEAALGVATETVEDAVHAGKSAAKQMEVARLLSRKRGRAD